MISGPTRKPYKTDRKDRRRVGVGAVYITPMKHSSGIFPTPSQQYRAQIIYRLYKNVNRLGLYLFSYYFSHEG